MDLYTTQVQMASTPLLHVILLTPEDLQRANRLIGNLERHRMKQNATYNAQIVTKKTKKPPLVLQTSYFTLNPPLSHDPTGQRHFLEVYIPNQ